MVPFRTDYDEVDKLVKRLIGAEMIGLVGRESVDIQGNSCTIFHVRKYSA